MDSLSSEQISEVTKAPIIKKRSAWGAFLIGTLCPGLGQFYCGEPKRALILFLITTVLTLVLGFLLKFKTNLLTFGIFLLVLFLLGIYVLIDGIVLSRKKKHYTLQSYNRWYVYVGIFFLNAYYWGPIEGIALPESFKTPTGSMLNTILIGDRFFVNDLEYGIRNPLTRKYIYLYSQPVRGDVISFDFRGNRDEIEAAEKVKYMKRILAVPGDTLLIRGALPYINGDISPKPLTGNLDNIFNPDENFTDPLIFPKGRKWNQDFYGPLIIPKKGDILKVNKENIDEWRIFIEREGGKVENTWSRLYINDIETDTYIVKENYYFVVGDNWYNSLDSRHFGFISENDVIGKIKMIYFSWDSSIKHSDFGSLLRSIRWDRIGKKIE